MRRDSERDRSMDRALRRSIDAASAAVRPDECVDGETLAAWTSGALQSDETVRIEQHVADCARCQALVATFARITPPEPASEPVWRRWHLRWLVPIATAATAVAFWVAVPEDQMPSRTEQVEQFAAREEAPQARAESNVPLPSRPTVIAEGPARDADLRKQSQSTANPSDITTRERKVLPGQRVDERPFEARNQVVALPPPATIAPEPSASARAAPSPPATADKSAAAPAASSLGATAGKSTASPTEAPAPPALREAPASAPAVPSGAAAGKPAARAEAAPPPPPVGASPPATPVSPRSTETLERDRLGARSAADVARHGIVPIEIISPNPSSRWRVVGRRQVERSTDGGATWARVDVTSTADLTAGSAPAARVAWIVGEGGTVFLTTDGARFVRIPFVTAVALVSVAATSDQAATVVTADGRVFRTTNRGATWTPTR